MMTGRKFALRALLFALLAGGCSVSPGVSTSQTPASPTAQVGTTTPAPDSTSATAGTDSAPAVPNVAGSAESGDLSDGYAQTLTNQSCFNFSNLGLLRACTAYVFNASYKARLPYYKSAKSADIQIVAFFRAELEQRYDGAARTFIENQTATTWPVPALVGANFPHIKIVSLTLASNPDGSQTATLHTLETWNIVTTGDQPPLFHEDNQPHTITMEAQSVLSRWVVMTIS